MRVTGSHLESKGIEPNLSKDSQDLASWTTQYFKEVYPWGSLAGMATLGGHSFNQLDVAIQAEGSNQGSVYMMRNYSYANESEFKQSVLARQTKRIEVGAWYPDERRPEAKKWRQVRPTLPMYRILAIDVDMSDYGGKCAWSPYGAFPFVGCGHGPREAACDRCWKLILEPGRRIVEYILREVWGFETLAFVYSGRKGYHCLVLDDDVCRHWNRDDNRQAVMKSLASWPSDSKHCEYIYGKILRPAWDRFASTDGTLVPLILFKEFLPRSHRSHIPQNETRNSNGLFKYITGELFTSEGDLISLDEDSSLSSHGSQSGPTMRGIWTRAVLRALFWPRVDEKVGKQVRHLLKAPFSPVPSTQKIAIVLKNPKRFVPSMAPSIQDVVRNPELLEESCSWFETLLRQSHDKSALI